MGLLDESEYHQHYHRADPASRPSYIVTQDDGSLKTVMNLSLLETRLERVFYKSLHKMERRQSRRRSELDPPPRGSHDLQ